MSLGTFVEMILIAREASRQRTWILSVRVLFSIRMEMRIAEDLLEILIGLRQWRIKPGKAIFPISLRLIPAILMKSGTSLL